MATIVSTANAEHYTWGGPEGTDSEAWWLVRDATLSVIEERMPPGTSETMHRHGLARQFFYVLEGQLTMAIEGETFLLRAGEGLEVSPGQPHQARNDGEEAVRFLVISQPPSHGDRIEEATCRS